MLDLDAHAETVKLARLLGVETERIAFVQRQPSAATRAFREAVSDALFGEHRHGFQRLAGLARLLPTALSATLAEKMLGATMSARIAGELSPEQALALARRLPVAFLARVSIELEPRRAARVIAGMPVELIVAVALALVERREYITMGRFIDALPDPALQACVSAIESDEAVLHIGFFTENKDRLDTLVRMLPQARLAGLVQVATDRQLWSEAFSLIVHLEDDMKGRMGDLAASQKPEVLAQLMQIAHAQNLWPAVFIAVAQMSPENQRRVVNLPALVHPEMLENLIAVGHEGRLWHKLLPLMRTMTPEMRNAAAEVALQQPAQVLRGMFDSVIEHSQWDDAIDLLASLPVGLQRRAGEKAARDFGKSYRRMWLKVEALGRAAELAALEEAYVQALNGRPR